MFIQKIPRILGSWSNSSFTHPDIPVCPSQASSGQQEGQIELSFQQKWTTECLSFK